MIREAIGRQPSVMLAVLELTAQLSWGPALEDHGHSLRREVPSRFGRQRGFDTRLGRSGRRVRTRSVRGLVTVAAAHRVDAVPVHSATQAEEVVHVAVVAL